MKTSAVIKTVFVLLRSVFVSCGPQTIDCDGRISCFQASEDRNGLEPKQDSKLRGSLISLNQAHNASTMGRRRGLISNVLIDFEDLPAKVSVGDFYNGGPSGGPNYGVSFSGNTVTAYVNSAPLPDGPSTPMGVWWPYFLENRGDFSYVNVANGFETRASFFFDSSIDTSYAIFSGLNGAGELLASGSLPITRSGIYIVSVWKRVDITFTGSAKSIEFIGVVDDPAMDDLVLGNRDPVAICKDVVKFTPPTCATCSVLPTHEDMVTAVNDGSYDPDKDILTFSFDNAGPFAAGSLTTVTMMVKDGFGGTAECSTVVAVPKGVLLDFEGIEEGMSLGDVTVTGVGGSDIVVSFSSGALATKSLDSGGTGAFANEPSPPSAIWWPPGSSTPVSITVAAGFQSHASFYYVTRTDAMYSLYDDFGNLLATGSLLATISSRKLDSTTTNILSDWKEEKIFFDGIATSILFSDVAGNTYIDDLRIGNSDPIAICKDASVTVDSDCQGKSLTKDDIVNALDDGSFDGDHDDLSYSLNATGPFPIGSTAVMMTVDDGLGGTSNCVGNIVVVNNDDDEDGICDFIDNCLNTAVGEIVFPSGASAGCSIADLCPCGSCVGKKKGLAQYKSCVVSISNTMVKAGIINKEMQKAITKNLASNKVCCM